MCSQIMSPRQLSQLFVSPFSMEFKQPSSSPRQREQLTWRTSALIWSGLRPFSFGESRMACTTLRIVGAHGARKYSISGSAKCSSVVRLLSAPPTPSSSMKNWNHFASCSSCPLVRGQSLFFGFSHVWFWLRSAAQSLWHRLSTLLFSAAAHLPHHPTSFGFLHHLFNGVCCPRSLKRGTSRGPIGCSGYPTRRPKGVSIASGDAVEHFLCAMFGPCCFLSSCACQCSLPMKSQLPELCGRL